MFFRNMEADPSGEVGNRRPPALLRGRTRSHSSDTAQKLVEDHLAVHTLIRAYQVPHTGRPALILIIYTLKY